jgi:hypothetical protein
MTKPSYEELERQNKYLSGELSKRDKGLETLRKHIRELEVSCAIAAEQSEATYKELVRVRGLLRRQWISVEERLPEKGQACLVVASGKTQYMAIKFDGKEFVWADGYDYGESAFDPFPSEQATDWMPLPEKTAGAESADIGKLDTADKCQHCGLPKGDMAHDDLSYNSHRYESGSAETGGEKVAPELRSLIQAIENCAIADSGPNGINADRLRDALVSAKAVLATFPRSSQNQTVSSGVEGAHEGTTADKSVALAESSLSQEPKA